MITDMQITWLIAMSTGALIGAVVGLLAMMVRSSSKLWFNVVLGMFGAIMIYTATSVMGMDAGTAGAVIIGSIGAIGFLTGHYIIRNRRRWANW